MGPSIASVLSLSFDFPLFCLALHFVPLLVFIDCFTSFGIQGAGDTTEGSEGQLTTPVTPKISESWSPGRVGLVKTPCGNRLAGSINGFSLCSDMQGGNGSSAFLGGMGLSENMLGGNGSGEEGADMYGDDGAKDGEDGVLSTGEEDWGTISETGSEHGSVQDS